MNEIRPIDVFDFVRQHPGMLLGLEVPTDWALATRVADDALVEGASRVTILRDGPWMFVVADVDWLRTQPDATPRDLFFDCLYHSPRGPQNSCRAEVIVHAFADAVYTRDREETLQIKGEPPIPAAVDALLADLPTWRRILGLRLEPAADSVNE